MENSGGNPCIYARKETPQPIHHERSENWLKRKDQRRNNKGQFTSPSKTAEKEMDVNLSFVSDEEFDCLTKSEGQPVHTNIDNELQLLPKENKLPPTKVYIKEKTIEPSISVRKSNRPPFANKPKNYAEYHTIRTLQRNFTGQIRRGGMWHT